MATTSVFVVVAAVVVVFVVVVAKHFSVVVVVAVVVVVVFCCYSGTSQVSISGGTGRDDAALSFRVFLFVVSRCSAAVTSRLAVGFAQLVDWLVIEPVIWMTGQVPHHRENQ